MAHSLEWVEELIRAHDRLTAKRSLVLAQAVATIMDGAAWSDMQHRLIEAIQTYE